MLASAAATGGVGAAPDRFDTILRHGTILDGSGLLPYQADVAMAEGRIARIGDLSAARARHDIDVRGLYVTPGFINIHSHASPAALPDAVNMLTQGVTTEIMNADGSGPLDLGAQFASLGRAGLAVNVGGYIGFNSVWADVVGPSERRPTAEEIERMRAAISAGLEAGAWGVSAGLDYKPAYFARTDEVIAVLTAASGARTNFTSHDRLTPELGFSSSAGMLETLRIGDGAGLLPVVTHMKITGRERGTAAAALRYLDAAGRDGRPAAADVYPYLAGMTQLGALLIPAWAQDGGRAGLSRRLADPELRARIVRETDEILRARIGGPEAVSIPVMKRSVPSFMAEWQTPPGETIVRLVEQMNPAAVLHFGIEADLEAILAHPAAAVACDCGATAATATHPRNYGSYPRVLGRYVRERGVLTWQEAIRKMTALPAATVGMVDRGYLAHGMAADVTVFDPRTVIDRATYEDPAVLSEGIRHVFVNGVAAVRDGKVTGARTGRVLARGPGMPSRPMTPNTRRGIRVKGEFGRARLDMDVSQAAGRRDARGRLRIVIPETGVSLSITRFGVLQVAERWSSLTGQAMMKPEGVERPVTVVIDAADPALASGDAAIVVDVEGVRAFRLTLPAAAVGSGAGPAGAGPRR